MISENIYKYIIIFHNNNIHFSVHFRAHGVNVNIYSKEASAQLIFEIKSALAAFTCATH